MKDISLCLLMIPFLWNSFLCEQKKIPIYIGEYNYTFTPQKVACKDTIDDKLDDGRKIKIYLLDCLGEMHVKIYRGKNLVEEGDYSSSLDLLKKYINGVNG